MKFLDAIPLSIVLIAALTLGLAPFVPEPHVWEKLKMLASGDLRQAIDILDLLMHGAPWLLLIAKLLRGLAARQSD
ncbi:MAG: RND transporter [Planktotalea sp.]|uniref:RND transporter n=1 Tax=Planktotalea sp. TaxID=2029877 RepID=UPI003C774B11